MGNTFSKPRKRRSPTKDPALKPTTQGNFYKPRKFTLNDPIFYDVSIDNFMKELAAKGIPGAAFDSSERDPPPRCHPETRLAIRGEISRFFADRERNKGLIWLVGPAGVGKSAIMQTLAEDPPTPDLILGASIFFSVNRRDNPSKIIATLAYQLAVKSKAYRDFIQDELAKDPALLEKALKSQFKKFIAEPFVTQGISSEGHKPFLILIDGLDECNNQNMQGTILYLVSSFCAKNPTAPLVWVIASRPEPHITRFLSRDDVAPSCTKKDIEVDSDQSREDVKHYLRNELESIRTKYPALDHFSCWPAEADFLKLATAAGGLFAFGKTVVEYIDNPNYANPSSRLEEVLEAIDDIRSRGEGKKHPMADLDALYSRIISKIPSDTLEDTKKLLLQICCPRSSFAREDNLQFDCNWLGMKTGAAYGALHHLYSVLHIPEAPDAPLKRLALRHESFRDYLIDFERSGMFPKGWEDEARELQRRCATRILTEASKARKTGQDPYTGVSLPWPSPTEYSQECKAAQYYCACRFVFDDLGESEGGNMLRDPGTVSALQLIDIRFSHEVELTVGVPFLHTSFLTIFGKYVGPRLRELNAFREVAIGAFNVGKIARGLLMTVFYHSGHHGQVPAFPDCKFKHSHDGKQGSGSSGPGRGHSTKHHYSFQHNCHCADLPLRKFEDRKTHSPNDILKVYTDVTGNYGLVHHLFPDSERTSCTWEYILPYQFEP